MSNQYFAICYRKKDSPLLQDWKCHKGAHSVHEANIRFNNDIGGDYNLQTLMVFCKNYWPASIKKALFKRHIKNTFYKDFSIDMPSS